MSTLETIFIVDDDPTSLRLMSRILQKHGYYIETAISGKDAKAKLKLGNLNIQLILLDMFLPDCTGVELCRDISTFDNLGGVPMMFLSGSEDNSSLLDAYRSGAVDYVVKPVRKAELLIRIRSHLQQFHRAQELLRQAEEIQKMQLQQLRYQQSALARSMLGGLVHEMNNPLSCIQANTKFIRSRCLKARKEEKLLNAAEMELILEACEDSDVDFLRLQDLTQRLLQLEDSEEKLAPLRQWLLTAAEMLSNRGGHNYTQNLSALAEYELCLPAAEAVSLFYALLESIWQSALQNSCGVERVYHFRLMQNAGLLILQIETGFPLTALGQVLESGSGISQFLLQDYVQNCGGKLPFEGGDEELYLLTLELPQKASLGQ